MAKCCGHGMCNSQAPEVYELNSEGYQFRELIDVPPGHEDEAREGVEWCPEQCLAVVEDTAS